ncbi:unnamed protein product (macronuclear) [Paramecium tetraurelia]|uniref:EGF-like domain-containing protein n=1 Tax=Paramecium tetraurelia TaxID=5888 RepID=A0CXP9_PARTE|nr:uncharacterized protein GSPATT00011198001 [Paramecium tetraurelia]CAK75566.1 unnamed protein product [Paramecium tetraurelia]|eukprot:XP_001442963.1 hypothetical protein (macronuclear) [Paramecium tetraurelia strain d4-2]
MIFLSTVIKIGVSFLILSGLTTCYYYYSSTNNTQILDQSVSAYQREQVVSHRDEIPVEATLHHERSILKKHAAGNWGPLRTQVDYSNVEPYVKKNQLAFIKDNLMTPALAFLQTTLKVFPRMSNTFVSQKCGGLSVQNLQKSGQVFDLGILMAASNDPTGTWWLRGVSCELDSVTNRPILGTLQVNLAIFNQVNVEKNNNEEWEYWLQQTLHEMIHLIGFNSVLYPYYVNAADNKVLGIDNVIRTFKNRQYVILTPVLDRVKRYFSCNAAVGALLEENGGQDIAGFHWERITFGNEIMTGDPFPDQVISEFTLALLEGTGWYLPNYTYAQIFGWGKDDGCTLTTGACSVVYEEFCKVKDQSGCSNNFNSVSGCYAGDQLSQGCNYWREQSDCRYKTDYNDKLAKLTGGSIGINSQCFITTLAQNAYATARSSCYSSQCVNGKVIVNVDGTAVTCTTSGQVISVKLGQQYGTITCPDITKFCAQLQFCPNNCSNRGVCISNSTCRCWVGYFGNDCSQRQSSA